MLTLLLTSLVMAGDPVPEPKPFGLLHMWTTAYDMDENEVASVRSSHTTPHTLFALLLSCSLTFTLVCIWAENMRVGSDTGSS